MSLFLEDIPLQKATELLENALREIGRWERLGIDTIPLDEYAAGRVTAESIWAKISSPHYHSSAMDGFALQSAQTVGARQNSPIVLRYRLSDVEGQVEYVDTGDPLPDWADTVIPIENTEPLDETGAVDRDARHPYAIRIRSAVTPWQHIRPMGEDMVATQLVMPAGQILRPVDLGALAASGHDEVRVAKKPHVAIIPTGSELVPVGSPVKVGEIIEFNSMMLAAQVNQWGGGAKRHPIVKDSFDAIRGVLSEAADESDLVLLLAGSSAGSEDYSSQVIASLGTILVHGVAIRPGHPVILGILDQKFERGAIPIIGVPGFPVSAALTGEIFIEPLLARWLGRQAYEPLHAPALITKKITSSAGDDEYLRVGVARVGERLLAAPLTKGSGVISSLAKADGIVIIPSGSQGLAPNSNVDVRLYRSPTELDQTLLAIGSHDMILDLASQFLAERHQRLVSANVGSLGGLIAIGRGEAHLAGSHLLDPETGVYNLPAIRQYLPDTQVVVIGFVQRQQGLMVIKGNPKRILNLDDYVRPDVTIINRQRGAGTRILLDYQLNRAEISTNQVKGYHREEFTHLAVGVAVASGRADVGLGIAGAAQALDLDFIPLYQEQYDLIIPVVYYHSRLMEPFLNLLSEKNFRQIVATIPGYEVIQMGDLIAEYPNHRK